MADNSIVDIKMYLSTPDQPPVTVGEFNEFWKSLTDEEKAEFKATELPSEE